MFWPGPSARQGGHGLVLSMPLLSNTETHQKGPETREERVSNTNGVSQTGMSLFHLASARRGVVC
jgi:hypothetical protein